MLFRDYPIVSIVFAVFAQGKTLFPDFRADIFVYNLKSIHTINVAHKFGHGFEKSRSRVELGTLDNASIMVGELLSID
jgi:hypothetical protein